MTLFPAEASSGFEQMLVTIETDEEKKFREDILKELKMSGGTPKNYRHKVTRRGTASTTLKRRIRVYISTWTA